LSKKIAIIGGGPAGIASAIQLKKYGLKPVLFESNEIGGLLHNAWRVENMPGFSIGIPGIKVIEKMKAHLIQSGTEVINRRVAKLDYQDGNFIIETDNGSQKYDFAIVASGTKPVRHPLAQSSSPEIQKYIFYEVYPLLKAENKHIVVVGAGDAAFDYSMNLARRNRVTILNRSDKIPALPLLKELVIKESNIDYLDFSEIDKIDLLKDNKLTVSLSNTIEKQISEVDYILFAIGREEQKDFYSDNLIFLESDLLKKGLLFLAGDVKNGLFRQTSIAVGDGIRCAMEIFHHLNNERQ